MARFHRRRPSRFRGLVLLMRAYRDYFISLDYRSRHALVIAWMMMLSGILVPRIPEGPILYAGMGFMIGLSVCMMLDLIELVRMQTKLIKKSEAKFREEGPRDSADGD